jgi:2-keto-4-pentenoate hydratase/2-oxohepta-3-ene-1,7-dioic acid hydratase in catechol pathway
VYVHVEGEQCVRWTLAPWELGARPAPGSSLPVHHSDLLCPAIPTKIVCVGRNYAAHAKELGNEVPAEPLLFFKPPSSLVGPLDPIVLPPQSERVEHESELAVVVGRRMRNVAKEDAMTHVFGYTVANDVTARDLQRRDGQWTRAKGFDSFCPVGPWIDTDIDPGHVRVLSRVNGTVRQDAFTSQMIFDVPTLLAYVSSVMTLMPGDLILTGTPEGVGPLGPGDVCEVELRDEKTDRSLCLLRSPVRLP